MLFGIWFDEQMSKSSSWPLHQVKESHILSVDLSQFEGEAASFLIQTPFHENVPIDSYLEKTMLLYVDAVSKKADSKKTPVLLSKGRCVSAELREWRLELLFLCVSTDYKAEYEALISSLPVRECLLSILFPGDLALDTQNTLVEWDRVSLKPNLTSFFPSEAAYDLSCEILSSGVVFSKNFPLTAFSFDVKAHWLRREWGERNLKLTAAFDNLFQSGLKGIHTFSPNTFKASWPKSGTRIRGPKNSKIKYWISKSDLQLDYSMSAFKFLSEKEPKRYIYNGILAVSWYFEQKISERLTLRLQTTQNSKNAQEVQERINFKHLEKKCHITQNSLFLSKDGKPIIKYLKAKALCCLNASKRNCFVEFRVSFLEAFHLTTRDSVRINFPSLQGGSLRTQSIVGKIIFYQFLIRNGKATARIKMAYLEDDLLHTLGDKETEPELIKGYPEEGSSPFINLTIENAGNEQEEKMKMSPLPSSVVLLQNPTRLSFQIQNPKNVQHQQLEFRETITF